MESGSDQMIQDWVSALKSGETKAFDHLFKHYSKRLYFFSLGYLKSKEEVFLRSGKTGKP
jgi:hypothetical protein